MYTSSCVLCTSVDVYHVHLQLCVVYIISCILYTLLAVYCVNHQLCTNYISCALFAVIVYNISYILCTLLAVYYVHHQLCHFIVSVTYIQMDNDIWSTFAAKCRREVKLSILSQISQLVSVLYIPDSIYSPDTWFSSSSTARMSLVARIKRLLIRSQSHTMSESLCFLYKFKGRNADTYYINNAIYFS